MPVDLMVYAVAYDKCVDCVRLEHDLYPVGYIEGVTETQVVDYLSFVTPPITLKERDIWSYCIKRDDD